MSELSEKRDNVKGSRCFKSKLSEHFVKEIRAIGKTKTLVEIGALYGVRPTSVWAILKHKTWKHI